MEFTSKLLNGFSNIKNEKYYCSWNFIRITNEL